jgi:hypothetical protein
MKMGSDDRAPAAIYKARRGRGPREPRAVAGTLRGAIAISSQNLEVVRRINAAFTAEIARLCSLTTTPTWSGEICSMRQKE